MGGELTTDYSDYTDYLVWNFFTICNFGEVANGTYFNLRNPCNLWLIYPISQTHLRISGSWITVACGPSAGRITVSLENSYSNFRLPELGLELSRNWR